jgi:hypothetical protein
MEIGAAVEEFQRRYSAGAVQGRLSVMNPPAGDDRVTTPGIRSAVFGVGTVPTRRKMTELDPTELNWTDS